RAALMSATLIYVVYLLCYMFDILHVFFFSSRRRHTRSKRDWSSDVCSSDLHCRNGSARFSSSGSPYPSTVRTLRLPSTRSLIPRSEERRVGKECRARWWANH